MLVYLKIGLEDGIFRPIFITAKRCHRWGCGLYNPESARCSAYLIQPCWFILASQRNDVRAGAW